MLQLIFNTDFFFSILRITAPILFATLGAVVGEKAGVSNICLLYTSPSPRDTT